MHYIFIIYIRSDVIILFWCSQKSQKQKLQQRWLGRLLLFNSLISSFTLVTCVFSYRVPKVCNRETSYCANDQKKGQKTKPQKIRANCTTSSVQSGRYKNIYCTWRTTRIHRYIILDFSACSIGNNSYYYYYLSYYRRDTLSGGEAESYIKRELFN